MHNHCYSFDNNCYLLCVAAKYYIPMSGTKQSIGLCNQIRVATQTIFIDVSELFYKVTKVFFRKMWFILKIKKKVLVRVIIRFVQNSNLSISTINYNFFIRFLNSLVFSVAFNV